MLTTEFRLVLFAEMPDLTGLDPDEIREWASCSTTCSRSSPSAWASAGAAHIDAAYPTDDPHVLRIMGLPEPAGADVYRYKLSALRGDQPAARDLFDFRPLADALARLILLPQTEPLVIGIHGPWGR